MERFERVEQYYKTRTYRVELFYKFTKFSFHQTFEFCFGSGSEMALGYLNSPELNANKFFTYEKYGKCYRTGDQGYINPETLQAHFVGRVDFQV